MIAAPFLRQELSPRYILNIDEQEQSEVPVRIAPRFALRRLMHWLKIQGWEDRLILLRRERGND
jgi:hypothetical protein